MRGMMLAALLLGAVLDVRAEAQVKIVGSDLLGADFPRELYAAAGRDSLAIAVAFDGSRPGIERLKSGRADLAIAVLPDPAAVPAGEFARFVVAYHRVLVLAPAASGVEQLSVDALARVFDGSFVGRTMRWQELGVAGEAGLGSIQVLVPDPGLELTTEFFRTAVLRGRACAGERYATLEALERLFDGESHALALSATPLTRPGAKVLAIAAKAGEPAFLPTAENLHSGDYPLRLALHVVYRRENLPVLRPLLRYLAGDAAAPQWERAGVMPLPASARALQVLALEKP